MSKTSAFKRKSKLPLIVKLVLVLALVGFVSFLSYFLFNLFTNQSNARATQVNILELWNNGSYDEIIGYGLEENKTHPMDAGTLIFSGFAYFHKAVAESTVEKKLPLIDASILSLRQALLIPNAPLKAEVHYILGKAYFHKGKFYADLAISNLEESIRDGYVAEDTYEYLGLAYSLVSRFQDASVCFLKAIEKNVTDGLLWTLGQTYYQMNDFDKAVIYLRQAISKTKDTSMEQKCHFLLGDIYIKQKNYDLASAEFSQILDKNPNSADAHFYLGEIQLAKGNKDDARAEWRKAFKIDPLHFNANQRLFN